MNEQDQKLADVSSAVFELEDRICAIQDLASLVAALGTCRLDIEPDALNAVGSALTRAAKDLREDYNSLFRMTRPEADPGTGE